MPKYMFAASYTKQGLDGVRAEGAQARVDALAPVFESMGGHLDGFYFAFGDVDAYALAELPDDETAAAVALAVSSSGAVTTRTIKLLTADQVDAAIAKAVPYRAPGA